MTKVKNTFEETTRLLRIYAVPGTSIYLVLDIYAPYDIAMILIVGYKALRSAGGLRRPLRSLRKEKSTSN